MPRVTQQAAAEARAFERGQPSLQPFPHLKLQAGVAKLSGTGDPLVWSLPDLSSFQLFCYSIIISFKSSHSVSLSELYLKGSVSLLHRESQQE